jgi:hypothetical protein
MGRGPRPADSQPTPAQAGSVAMPRDGDPMNDKSLSAGPDARMEAFDGFPYLVTRIGRTPLRHVVLLPADWSRGHLLEVACRQSLANQLETCLCQGPADAVYVTVHGSWSAGNVLPWGLPVVDGLEVSEPFPPTRELRARRARLKAFARRHGKNGYLVGDGMEGGRRASSEDVDRLSGRDETGIPRGLQRCRECGVFRGDYLALDGEGNGDRIPRVVPVHCRCENHNRCARCRSLLSERRLSAYFFDEPSLSVRYLAAYAALGHRCA